MYKYISLKYTDPVYIAVRKQMADTYKLMRKDNPAMARLLYKLNKRVECDMNKAVEDYFFNGDSDSGLNVLFK